MPILRRARPEDAAFLADLAGEAFAAYGDYRPLVGAWAAEAGTADPQVEVTVAEHDGAPAGAAFLAFLRPPEPKVGDLLALAVAAPFRGCGIGRALVAHVVARARDVAQRPDGISTLRLVVAETNAAARRLFESAGFAYYDAAEGSYQMGQKALHMRLPLRRRGPRRRLI